MSESQAAMTLAD